MILLKMLRPRVVFVIFLFSLLGILQAGEQLVVTPTLISIFLLLSFWYINATCINDIADLKIDKINLKAAPDRPLLNHQTSKRYLTILAVLTALCAVVLGFVLDTRVGYLSLLATFLNYAYSLPPLRLSYRGIVAILILPVGYVFLPYMIGVWSYHLPFTSSGELLLLALYITFIGRIILKDFRDVVGDKRFGKKTFLVRYGQRTTCIASGTAFLLGGILLLPLLPREPLIYLPFLLLLSCMILAVYFLTTAKVLSEQLLYIRSIVRTATGSLFCLLLFLSMKNAMMNYSSIAWALIALSSLFFIFFINLVQLKKRLLEPLV